MLEGLLGSTADLKLCARRRVSSRLAELQARPSVIVSTKHGFQIGRVREADVRSLRAPGVGIVKHGSGDELVPTFQHHLQFGRGRQPIGVAAVGTPLSAAERLESRDDPIRRDAGVAG